MSQHRQVVITGIGVVSPIGIGKDAFWDSLAAGRSGVAMLPVLRDTVVPVRFGALVSDFDAKQYVKPRKSLKVMSHEIQLGFAAATLAVEDAALPTESLDPDRFGVLYGCEMLYGAPEELITIYRNSIVDNHYDHDKWGERLAADIFPLWMLKYLPNMVACHVGIALDARGPNNTIVLGEASSLLALIECQRVIERGHADVMIAGGTGSRLHMTAGLWRGDNNLSHRNDDPAAASRPFDAHRDGMVNGEGAAVLILESVEHAQARGARVLATLRGGGHGFESRPQGRATSGQALRHAIDRALADAQLTPGDVGHVNAHGISLVEDDRLEARAIRDALGDVPVTAPKSFFGNLGGGGGMVELVASLLALERGQVPVTLNYDEPDPHCPINVVHGRPLPIDKPTVLAVNQSGTGQAAAVLVSQV